MTKIFIFSLLMGTSAFALVPVSDVHINLVSGCGAPPPPGAPPPSCPSELMIWFKVMSSGPCHHYEGVILNGSLRIKDSLLQGCGTPDNGPADISVSMNLPTGSISAPLKVLNPQIIYPLPRP